MFFLVSLAKPLALSIVPICIILFFPGKALNFIHYPSQNLKQALILLPIAIFCLNAILSFNLSQKRLMLLFLSATSAYFLYLKNFLVPSNFILPVSLSFSVCYMLRERWLTGTKTIFFLIVVLSPLLAFNTEIPILHFSSDHSVPAVLLFSLIGIFSTDFTLRKFSAYALSAFLPLLTYKFFGERIPFAIATSLFSFVLLIGVYRIYWQQIYIDELTEIPNRRALTDRFKNLGHPYSLAMVDIDHFKKLNDTYGHEAGDDALRMVAKILYQKSGQRAYRYGGEEFCIVYKKTNVEKAKEQLEIIRKKLEKTNFVIRSSKADRKKTTKKQRGRVKIRQKTVKITVSMGVAKASSQDRTPEAVLAKADQLLYLSKKNGRNRITSLALFFSFLVSGLIQGCTEPVPRATKFKKEEMRFFPGALYTPEHGGMWFAIESGLYGMWETFKHHMIIYNKGRLPEKEDLHYKPVLESVFDESQALPSLYSSFCESKNQIYPLAVKIRSMLPGPKTDHSLHAGSFMGSATNLPPVKSQNRAPNFESVYFWGLPAKEPKALEAYINARNQKEILELKKANSKIKNPDRMYKQPEIYSGIPIFVRLLKTNEIYMLENKFDVYHIPRKAKRIGVSQIVQRWTAIDSGTVTIEPNIKISSSGKFPPQFFYSDEVLHLNVINDGKHTSKHPLAVHPLNLAYHGDLALLRRHYSMELPKPFQLAFFGKDYGREKKDIVFNKQLIWREYIRVFTKVQPIAVTKSSVPEFLVSLDLMKFCKYAVPLFDSKALNQENSSSPAKPQNFDEDLENL